MTTNVRWKAAWLLSALTTIAACGGGQTPPSAATPAEPSPIALAVGGRSNAAASVAALGHTVAAVWTASIDDTSDIYCSVSSDGGKTFAAPVRVNDIGGDARASGEQAARVAVGTGHVIHVAWPARRDGRSLIRYAASKDGGRTFSPAVTVAGDASPGLRGWQALTLGYDGSVQVVWLDGRHADPAMHRRGHPHAKPGVRRPAAGSGPRQDIFHATVPQSGKGNGARSDRLVQTNVCFCCKTAVATSGEHVYAAWRHIFPGSLRDIAVARSRDNGITFGDPMRVSEDGWKIDACPDDGPAMVADGHGGIHIAWPTLVAGDMPKKGIFYSTLTGDAFPPRVRLDAGDADPAHPQMASDEHTTIVVVWDERVGETRRVVFRPVSEGKPLPPQFFSGDGVSYPVVAGGEGYWVVLWTAHRAADRSVIEGRRVPSTGKP